MTSLLRIAGSSSRRPLTYASPISPAHAIHSATKARSASGRTRAAFMGCAVGPCGPLPPRALDHTRRPDDHRAVAGWNAGPLRPQSAPFRVDAVSPGSTTLPRLAALLQSVGLSISEREIQRLLTEKQDGFLDETRDVLRAGLRNSPWISVAAILDHQERWLVSRRRRSARPDKGPMRRLSLLRNGLCAVYARILAAANRKAT